MPRTWFITGTSSGFGRALTEELLARGDRVVATVRHPATLDDLVDRYGDQLRVAKLDVIVSARGFSASVTPSNAAMIALRRNSHSQGPFTCLDAR